MKMTEGSNMLRVYRNDKKGATAFFRNRPFINSITALLQGLPTHDVKVLFHACSIGAEPFSFATNWKLRQMEQTMPELHLETTDIEAGFMEIARQAVYPQQILADMTEDERAWFRPVGDGNVKLDQTIRNMVRFNQPASILDLSAQSYDAVFAMNVLTYLTEPQQTAAIRKMAEYTRHYLCLTAFHPDQIRKDIEDVGFVPVTDNMIAIHEGWGDRVRPNGAVPGSPDYSWILPPFEANSPDYSWRYCAIFKRVADGERFVS